MKLNPAQQAIFDERIEKRMSKLRRAHARALAELRGALDAAVHENRQLRADLAALAWIEHIIRFSSENVLTWRHWFGRRSKD